MRTHTFRAWSSTMRLVVEDDRALAPAVEDLVAMLGRVDRAASRFRADSALSVANSRAGRPSPVPSLLADVVLAALDAARRTGGAVDPTVGRSLAGLGYDRDITVIGSDIAPHPTPAGRWRAVRVDRRVGLLTVPFGSALDLGATAKAWTADRAARTLAARYDTGVLVELGGDVAVAGHRPGGWVLSVAEREGADGQKIVLHSGGVATSTTTVRAWRQGGTHVHHIVDPRTGRPADGPWRTATVAADTAYDANVASTAAIVLGERAADWLTDHGFAARLVARDGSVTTTAGWPAPLLEAVA